MGSHPFFLINIGFSSNERLQDLKPVESCSLKALLKLSAIIYYLNLVQINSKMKFKLSKLRSHFTLECRFSFNFSEIT
jgi:hypothetical protein